MSIAHLDDGLVIKACKRRHLLTAPLVRKLIPEQAFRVRQGSYKSSITNWPVADWPEFYKELPYPAADV